MHPTCMHCLPARCSALLPVPGAGSPAEGPPEMAVPILLPVGAVGVQQEGAQDHAVLDGQAAQRVKVLLGQAPVQHVQILLQALGQLRLGDNARAALQAPADQDLGRQVAKGKTPVANVNGDREPGFRHTTCRALMGYGEALMGLW